MYNIFRQVSNFHAHKNQFDLYKFAVTGDVVNLRDHQMALLIKRPRCVVQ
jgi:hypothetical protein